MNRLEFLGCAEDICSTPNVIKYFVDGDSCSLHHCLFKILQEKVKCTEAEVVYSLIRSHHSSYIHSTTTLGMMIKYWYEELIQLIVQGVPQELVVQYLKEAVEYCLKAANNFAKSFHGHDAASWDPNRLTLNPMHYQHDRSLPNPTLMFEKYDDNHFTRTSLKQNNCRGAKRNLDETDNQSNCGEYEFSSCFLDSGNFTETEKVITRSTPQNVPWIKKREDVLKDVQKWSLNLHGIFSNIGYSECVSGDENFSQGEIIESNGKKCSGRLQSHGVGQACDSEQLSDNTVSCDSSDIIHLLIQGLAHGAQSLINTMHSVLNILNCMGAFSPHTFHRVVALSVSGKLQPAQIIPGAVLQIPQQQLYSMHLRHNQLKQVTYRCVVMASDLSPNHKHKGFQQQQQCQYVKEHMGQQEWEDEVAHHLKTLDIQLLVLSGVCSSKLRDKCASMDVLILDEQPLSVIHRLAQTLRVHPHEYVHLCTKEDISSDVCVTVLEADWDCSSPRKALVQLHQKRSKVETVTVLFTHPVQGLAKVHADQFLHYWSRVVSVLSTRKYLPGAGATEHHMMAALESAVFQTPLQQEVYSAVARGFQKYIDCIHRNTLDVFVTFDDLLGKSEAWRSACLGASLLLTCYSK